MKTLQKTRRCLTSNIENRLKGSGQRICNDSGGWSLGIVKTFRSTQ